jgi:type II secretory pathway component PulC
MHHAQSKGRVCECITALSLLIALAAPGSADASPPDSPSPSPSSPLDKAAVAPPFRVTGTVIAPPERFVHLLVVDEKGNEEGTMRVREKETVKGYLIKQIDNHRVYFEREGKTFRIDVGNDKPAVEEHTPGFTKTPEQQPVQQKKRKATFIPPPDNIEEIKKQTDAFIEKLKEHPEFKKRLEEKKQQLREQGKQAAPVD